MVSTSVRGRGKSFQRRRVDHSQDDKDHPVVSTDYASSELPVSYPQMQLVGRTRQVFLSEIVSRTKALFSHLVPAKGVEHFYFETSNFWATPSSL